jgi:aminoglycoside phosphotransferase (APT) family kinase protein
MCDSRLGGRRLPLVQAHGDFTESNCLFDAKGRLKAVVDWEVAAAEGLPLLDLLQLMPIASESSSHPRWQRFDAWLDIWRVPEKAASDPVLGRYLEALELPVEAVQPLVLLQWVHHVADRVSARRDDERWMRLRVRQPLDQLGRIL